MDPHTHDRITRLANVVFKLSMCISVPEDNKLAWQALKEIQDELFKLGAEVPHERRSDQAGPET